MSQPAAKQNDMVQSVDTHIVIIPGTPPIPTPIPHPFNGIIDSNVSTDVLIEGQGAAVVGSTATNQPPHIPQGGSFQVPPSNRGQILNGSATVLINGKPAARNGDPVLVCNDPADLPNGTIIAAGTVLIG